MSKQKRLFIDGSSREGSPETYTDWFRKLKLDPCMSYWPKRVVSIVSASRSGSSIFKYALCLHPDLCSLAGEEEPYYKLARNGYPWHKSDEFHKCHRPDMVKMLIANELYNYQSEHNRRILQQGMIEEPPFVDPIKCRVTPTLVLKTPQNCYRKGVIEQLYPDAEIIYISIHRDPPAVVNGLLDGWLSKDFKARQLPDGRWWKFDMPPDWDIDEFLLHRCVNQWSCAEWYIQDWHKICYQVVFEQFLQDWEHQCNIVWEFLGLPKYRLIIRTLPELMITDDPSPERWKIKRPWLEGIDFCRPLKGPASEGL